MSLLNGKNLKAKNISELERVKAELV